MTFFWLTISYMGVTAVVVTIEHMVFGRRWRRNETARRVMGHATILLLAMAFVPLGLIDFQSLIAFAAATIVAGFVVSGFEVWENERRNAERAAAARRVIDGQDTGLGA